LEQQVSLLPYVEHYMLEVFKADNPNIIFKQVKPNKNVTIYSDNKYGYQLRSLKSFKIGDTVLENNIEKISKDVKVILKTQLDSQDFYILLNTDDHFTQREAWNDY
jgi:hypothetical protein